MVNHGLIIAVLFIVIGWIYERRKTWQTSELRGLQRPAPILAAVFTVAMLAAIGLPGLNGFVGEFLVLAGTFLTHRWWAVVATGRRGAGRDLPAVGLPAGLPPRARRGQRQDARPVVARGARRGAARRPHRLPRRVPQAGPRPHHALGRPSRPPRRHEHRHPPAGRGQRSGPTVRRVLTGLDQLLGLGEAADDRAALPSSPWSPPKIDYLSILPVLVLLGGAVAILAVALGAAPAGRRHLGHGHGGHDGARRAVAVARAVVRRVQTTAPTCAIDSAVVEDGFSAFVAVLVSSAVFVSALVGDGWMRRERVDRARVPGPHAPVLGRGP